MYDLPWLDAPERIEQSGQEETQHPNVVATGDENDDREPRSGEVLLMDEIAVDSYEDIKLGFRFPQECAVQPAGPAVLADSANSEAGQLALEPTGYALVEQDTCGIVHATRPRSASAACSRNCIACSRSTPGKSSRNSLIESPASR